MSKKTFIRNNRKEIDNYIRKALNSSAFKLNDADREEWLINDEGLYNWARSEGVNL